MPTEHPTLWACTYGNSIFYRREKLAKETTLEIKIDRMYVNYLGF